MEIIINFLTKKISCSVDAFARTSAVSVPTISFLKSLCTFANYLEFRLFFSLSLSSGLLNLYHKFPWGNWKYSFMLTLINMNRLIISPNAICIFGQTFSIKQNRVSEWVSERKTSLKWGNRNKRKMYQTKSTHFNLNKRWRVLFVPRCC